MGLVGGVKVVEPVVPLVVATVVSVEVLAEVLAEVVVAEVVAAEVVEVPAGAVDDVSVIGFPLRSPLIRDEAFSGDPAQLLKLATSLVPAGLVDVDSGGGSVEEKVVDAVVVEAETVVVVVAAVLSVVWA